MTEDNDWLAYYEWQYVEDVKRNKHYKNTANLKAGGSLADVPATTTDPDRERHVGMVKLWKLWDLRQREKHVFADGADKFLLEGEEAPYCPLAIIKFYEIPDEWYPLPPVYNWISPQDEINEIREARRVHRRRFVRRYTYRDGAIDVAELEKLETATDGVYARANTDNPIQIVPDAPIDAGNAREALAESKEDYAQITGVTGEQRGVPETETATQANIMNVRSQIRESQARVQVADWLAQVARLMLLCLRDKMQLPFWVRINTDPYAQDQASQQRTMQQWQEVSAGDLGDIDVDVKVDIASLSPVSEDAQRQAWNQVLALLTNPALLMILMQPNPSNPQEPSPLLRKTLGYYGIKSDQEVREIMRVGMMVLQQIQQQQMMAAAAKQPAMMPGGTPMGASPGQAPAGMPSAGPMVQ